MPICTAVSNGSKPSDRDPWRWYSPHRAIVLLGVVLTLVALAGGILGVVNSARAETLNAQLTGRYLVLLPPVRQIRASENAFQVLADGGVQQLRSGHHARDRSGERFPRHEQGLPHPSAPPRIAGQCRPRSSSGRPDDGLRRLAVESGCLPGRRTADGKYRAFGCRGEVGRSETRCNPRLPAGDHRRSSEHDGRPGTSGSQQCPGRPCVVPCHRRGRLCHRDDGPRSCTRCGWSVSSPGVRPFSPTSPRGSRSRRASKPHWRCRKRRRPSSIWWQRL